MILLIIKIIICTLLRKMGHQNLVILNFTKKLIYGILLKWIIILMSNFVYHNILYNN